MISSAVATAALAAIWICPKGPSSPDANVAVFRRAVEVRKPVLRADWRVTALGTFEAKVNGRVVSRFLDPGFTQPEKTRYEVSYDVTPSVLPGTNVFEAVVAPTWWRCRMTRRAYPKVGAPNPTRSALRATLRLAYRDGTSEEIGTDGGWLSAYTGPVTDAGVFDGERYDARKPVAGLEASVPCDDFKGEVLLRRGPPVSLREDLTLRPRKAYVWQGVTGEKGTNEYGKVVVRRRYGDGVPMEVGAGETLVIDFGQNAAAIPRFTLEGPRDAVMTVKTGEMLNDSNGERARRCDGPAGSVMLANLRSAAADIRYVFREGRQDYAPHFTFFGYRYVSVTATRPIRIVSAVSVPVSSVSRDSESPCLVTGNAKVNRLVENVRWGFRSNYLEVPTDCPQRDERLGWTADTMAFVSAAAYSADVRDFLGKWLKDLRDCQGADGTFPTLAPLVWAFHGYGAVTGWSDAGVIVPHCLWKRYGDRELLEEHWEAMTRYMDFIVAHRGPDKQDYGDWQAFEHSYVEPGGVNLSSPERYRECFRGFFFVWDAQAMKEMSRDLGKAEEARRYGELEGIARREFAEKYMGADGLMDPYYRGQTTDLFLLKLGLVEGAAREKVKAHLVADIRAHGGCLQTGFLGTMILMETLSEAGLTDVAYDLLLQEKCPSWLFSVNNGATTIWERWDCYDPAKGFQDPGMNSFNHYSYGAVYAWMMSTVAGIRTDPASPGMRHFVLAPQPDERLGFVRAAYDAPCGRIESEWRCTDGTCLWRFRVPEGATATVRVPGQPDREFGAGEQTVSFALSGRKDQSADGRERVRIGGEFKADVLTVSDGPRIDGRLDERVWQEVKWESGFQRFRGSRTGRAPKAQTSFAVLADGENVYFGARCSHLKVDWLRGRNDAIWQAEAVELYLAPSGSTFDFYQFLMTYQGLRHQAYFSENGGIQPDPYAPEWEYKVSDAEDGWTLEARIPLAAFYMTRTDSWKTDWKLNVARTYREEELFDFSCWIDGKGYRDLANFQTMGGFPVRRPQEDVWVRSVEAVARGLTSDSKVEGSLKVFVSAAQGGAARLEATCARPQDVMLKAGENAFVLPAAFPGNGRHPIEVRLTREGERPLVRSYPTLVDYQALRVKVSKPAYRNNFYPGQCSDEVAGHVASAVRGAVTVMLAGPGFETQSVTLPEGGGDFAFDTKGFQEGTAMLTVTAGSDVRTVKVRKILKNPSGGSVSWIENGNLVVDGRPTFRRNMYAEWYLGGAAFRTKYESGFYDLHQTEEVRGCGTLEPNRLIRGMETKEAIRDVKPCAEIFAAMDKRIDEALDSPDKSKVFWYISDEPECRSVSPVYLRHMYEHVCDRDPYHVVLCGSRAGETYIDCADWFETHPYLNPQVDENGKRVYGRHFRELGGYVEAFRPQDHPDKCVGCMPTAFAYPTGCSPTFREFVTHTWNFLIHGVRTFYHYAYHEFGDTARLYRGVKFVNESAERLSDYFLLGRRTVLRADADIEAALWELDGKSLFAVVNMTDRPQVVTLDGVRGDFCEFRGRRTYSSGWFGSSIRVELAPLEAVAATTERLDGGLASYEAAEAEVLAAEKMRLGRDNQLLGRRYDVTLKTSTAETSFHRFCDGTRDVLAWSDRKGCVKFVEMDVSKVAPAFRRLNVFGVNLGGLTVRISDDGSNWTTVEPVGSQAMDNGRSLLFGTVLTPKHIRLEFGEDGVELYEIELPKIPRLDGGCRAPPPRRLGGVGT